MIKTWPGQTKEEWMQEYRRNQNLTPEEREKELNDFLAEMKKRDEAKASEKNAKIQKASEDPFKNCDHPNSLENNEATILWLIVMAVATIFKFNWIIWIVATIIWRKYITRHKRKK